jgi:hypothetical protein
VGFRGSAAEGDRGRAEEKKTMNNLRLDRSSQQHGGKVRLKMYRE